MRNVFCIFALLCTSVYAFDVTDPSRDLERLVNVQKVVAEALLRSLQFFQQETTQKLEIKLNELKTEALVDIHTTINTAFEQVNLAINKGKEEGKSVNQCEAYARNKLETKNTNAIAGLDTCAQNGHTAMEEPLANVAKSVEAVQKLLIDLDVIVPNCYSPSFIKMRACVVANLYLTRSSLKRIESNAKQVTGTAAVTYAKTIIDVRSCIAINTSDVRTSSTNIIIFTDNCIRNAPKDILKPTTNLYPFYLSNFALN